MKKQLMVATAVAALVAAVAAPVTATSPKNNDGEHKQYVCHRTMSSNADKAFVVVEVDYATWELGGEPEAEGANGHQRDHNKDRDRNEPAVNDNLYTAPLEEGERPPKHLSEAEAEESCGAPPLVES